MSNTRNTPAEALEYHYPLRVREYGIRDGSSGAGRQHGGRGLVREVELLAPATLTLLTDRRESCPYGLAGGASGVHGVNEVLQAGEWAVLPHKGTVELPVGAVFRIATPGGGGWGTAEVLE
jgi:N-methylhydantoinase B